MTYLIVLITIVGLLIGSFLNVCIYRVPKRESIVFPPSHCTSCGTRLKPIDLMPVFSYMFYKGRCKYCRERISPQYPIIEILTCSIFLLCFIKFGLSLDFLFHIILFCMLIVISSIDYFHQIISDGFIIFIFIFGLAYKLVEYMIIGQALNIVDSLMGALIGGGFLLLIALVSKGGMGGGDIKLMSALGLWIGWKYTILALLLSFIIGGILSLVLLLFKIKSRRDVIPFGPFLSLGFVVTVLYGESIINWYMNMLI